YLQPQPPLLIISLSGLTKSLVSESFPTLRELDDFGVSTKAVLPCFPSQNNTNKLAIATGLFPQAQNFDSDAISGLINASDFGTKQPIWLAYKQQINGITALHSWPLHPFEDDATNRTSSLSCSKDGGVRVFLPSTTPTRWHYGDSDIAGDVIILTRRGMEKCRNCKPKEMTDLSGFDYLDESMQTVFYAQGPSFKSGAVLPPFQNVEYMNLWLDLLNMHYVPNNGSVGFMNEILNQPIKRERSRRFGIRECPFTQEERVVNCGGCTALQKVRVANWMNSCTQPNRPVVMLSSTSSLLCYQKICEKLIVRGTSGDKSRALVELFHSNNTLARSQSQCLFVSSRYELQCPTLSVPEGQELHSLSANPKK
ncbi:hypothetical protein ANCDUO_17320, partial [Ancylostoma duodenale]